MSGANGQLAEIVRQELTLLVGILEQRIVLDHEMRFERLCIVFGVDDVDDAHAVLRATMPATDAATRPAPPTRRVCSASSGVTPRPVSPT